MPVLFSVLGKKGAGKSEVLECLIRSLTQKGFRVGVIKRLARPDLEIDEPGKDTYRYRMQGASTVILSGRRRLAVFKNLQEETPLEELLLHYEGFHFVFLEGYELEGAQKIEIQDGEEINIEHLTRDLLRHCERNEAISSRISGACPEADRLLRPPTVGSQ